MFLDGEPFDEGDVSEYNPKDDERHRNLMRAHDLRREVNWDRVLKDRRRSEEPLAYLDCPGREAGVFLEVTGHGWLVFRARENPDDPKGKLDWITCALVGKNEV